MNTNFYWHAPETEFTLPTGETVFSGVDRSTMAMHIGKRSVAGLFCWDCGVTLCNLGPEGVHSSSGEKGWYKKCPKCGAEPVSEGLKSGPVAVELGFAKPRPERPKGVRGCSSFIWQQEPEKVKAACKAFADKLVIEDEYRQQYTGQEFLDMLEFNCPINILHLGGYFE